MIIPNLDPDFILFFISYTLESILILFECDLWNFQVNWLHQLQVFDL